MQNFIQYNTFIIAALVISGAILLIPLLLRIGNKSAAPFGNSLLRREPVAPVSSKNIQAPATAAPAVPGVRVGHGKQSPLDTFIACLDEALETHYRDWVEPLVNAAEGTTFALHSVTVEMTATNLPLMQFISDLKPAVLKRVFIDRLARSTGHAHYDQAKFYGIAFRNGAEARAADGDVIRVLKAHGGERMEVALVFQGEPDYRAPRKTQLRSADDEAVGGNSKTHATIATLDITLPGEDIRTVVLTRTPFTIGSHPDADLYIDIPCISGTHAVLDACTGGGVTITDHKSTNGTWVNGMRIAYNTPMRLNTRALKLLAGAKPGADVPLIEYHSKVELKGSSGVSTGVTVNATGSGTSATVIQDLPGIVASTSNETRITDEAPTAPATPQAPTVQAMLQLIHPDGTQAEFPLTTLGIEIGREAGDNGITAPASALRVSRHHLRLVSWAHNTGVFVENLAVDRGGTYLDGQRQDAQFIWRYADAKRPSEGYISLGTPGIAEGGLRLRLLRGASA